MHSDDNIQVAAARWSRPIQSGKLRWWQSPSILVHLNRIVCGTSLQGPWAGLKSRIQKIAPDGFNRGISIGCGAGAKGIQLVKSGLVKHFDLFEISPTRVEQGLRLAQANGIDKQVSYFLENAFDQTLGTYDLVYWNNALHHMLDVGAAITWSRAHLIPGGWFVMDDFVGPSRFQWSDANLEYATRVRCLLPERFLRNPSDLTKQLPVEVRRPTVGSMIKDYPTEASDSDRILSSLIKIFPDALIIPTGGFLYNLALNDVIAHFDETRDDLPLLQSILMSDEFLAFGGMTHYATALAQR